MSSPPALTDPVALARHRARASDLWLQSLAIDEVQDRLAMVNRAFTAPAVVTPFADLWADALQDALIVPDEDVLALEPGAHDLVIHALSLHWANDPVGQLIQCRRALKPDGLLLAVTLGGQTLQELRAVLAQAESECMGGLSPRVAPMGEVRDLGALLQRSGLNLPVADVVPFQVSYASAWALMRDLRKMGETNALFGRLRKPTPRALFDKATALYAQSFPAEDGRVTASFEIVVLTGWAPDDSQPQPLRPGSASARLADALGTDETSLPD